MREILFRGKHVDNGEWVYGVPVIAKDDIADKDIIVMVDNPNEIVPMEGLALFEQVDPETVGQFTGLTDKNGKKIFEGDICNISIPRIDGGFNRHNKCLCSYEDGMYKFSSYSDIYFCMGNGYGYPDTCHQNIEVIDNIYDNPELLEVAE